MTPDPKTIEANGIRFAYLAAGDPSAPLALCFHGFPDTPHTWSALMPALAEAGYYVVAPWIRGYTPTSAPPDGDYSGAALGRDVLALIDAFGRERAKVVGHDWGAMHAYAAANLGPERVERMVVSAIPHSLALRPDLEFVRRSYHFFTLPLPGAAGRVARDDFAYVDWICKKWSPGWSPTPEELAPVKECFADGGLAGALGYYRSLAAPPWTRAARETRKALFRKTSVPTLAFGGADDGALNVRVFDQSHRAFTGEYRFVEVEGAGHFLHLEKPELFVRETLAFLEG